jgi:hypothetical protein
MASENEADIRVLTGDQGKGKSNTGVAYSLDDYFANAKAIFPSGKQYPIVGIFPDYLCKTEDGRILRLPKDYRERGIRIESPIKIFANFHLYGVKYTYMDIPKMVANLNSPLLRYAWFMIDENHMVDKRYSMSMIGKIIAGSGFAGSVRKRHLHLVIMMQYKSMVDLRFRVFATTTVLCDYDKRTKYINLTISRKGERKKQSVSYYAPQYWRFYDTDELIPIPEHVIEKAKALVGAE